MVSRFRTASRHWSLLAAAVLAIGSAVFAAQPDAPMDLSGPTPEIEAVPTFPGGLLNLDAPVAEAPVASAPKPVVTAELHPLEGASDIVVLQVRIEIPEEHYSYSQSKINKKPTRITVEETPGLTPAEKAFSESPAAKLHFDEAFQADIEKHEGTVVFSKQYKTTDPKGLANVTMTGNVNLLLCKKDQCTPFPKLPFKATYSATSVSVETVPVSVPGVSSASGSGTLWSNLLLAFVGGIILNVMPCVLPVIGIKVVSFVEQAGENRLRIFALNWTYAAGSLMVFLILGTLAAFFSVNSGQLFQSDVFKIVFGIVVFAMALSLLGVYELNLPGVATGFGLQSEKEGLIGAFISGVVATFLATPCIGPFMGPALGWSVGQSRPVIYAIWTALGLGMCLPYLILGIAPKLISWLPRPGMWMVRFKQFSGFLLLATVVFLIQPLERRSKAPAPSTGEMPVVISADSLAPDSIASRKPEVSKPLTGVLIALLGIGIGLWMIGNLYNHASSAGEKWRVRLAALAIALPISWYGVSDQLGLRFMPNYELAWEDWSEMRMNSHLAEGKPVLVDFTADWCTTCKYNELTALNVASTKSFVEKHGVVTMKADFTDESPEIKKWLEKFKAAGVPLLVIFPPGDSSQPIVFDGIVTKGQVLSRLEEAMKRGKAAQSKKDANSTALLATP